jgi:hypothetical protein
MDLSRTTVFTGEMSRKGYRLNRLAMSLTNAANREKYRADEAGGLSHQLHGEHFGFVNPDWDNEFMDRLESDPESLAALPHKTWMERGGTESVEMIIWLAMRAALGSQVRRVHRNYCAPLLTGYGLLALEPA